jgi:hypothetical protein
MAHDGAGDDVRPRPVERRRRRSPARRETTIFCRAGSRRTESATR